MIDALSRLIIDVSVFTPTGLILRAINPLKYYNRWRDEKFHHLSLSLTTRILNTQMEAYIQDKLDAGNAVSKTMERK